MKRRKSFSINRIKISNKTPKEVSKLFAEYPYDDVTGYGLSEIEVEGDLLSAVLIKRNFTYIREYNINKKEFEKKSISIFSEIPFRIDFKNSFLYANNSLANLLQVKAAIRNILNSDFEISGLDKSPYKIYQSLKATKIKFEVTAITIDKFNFKDGAIGKYFAVVSNTNIGIELIKLYKESISKIGFTFKTYQVYFFSNNIFSIIGESDEIEKHLEDFKIIIK